MRYVILSIFCLCFSMQVQALEPITAEWHQVPIALALQILAEASAKNMVVDPNVAGSVDLHLHDTLPQDALQVLLSTHALVSEKQGEISYIATPATLIKKKQAEWRWHQTLAETEPLQQASWRLQYAKVDELVHTLQQTGNFLSKRGQWHADTRTNTLFAEDISERIAALQVLIREIDVAVPQILIEARLASVDSDAKRELGVDFVEHEVTSGVVDERNSGQVHVGELTLAWLPLADHAHLDVNLHALESTGRGELLSSPTLFTANQKPASIEAGEEIPYQEISRSGATGVAFKKAVLSLKVTPEVLPGNKVLLSIQINQDKPSNRIVQGVPAITTREIRTSVMVNNGQTLVLGGIYERHNEREEQGIPYLDKIPLVGMLFQQQNESESKRELLVFVTPLIKSPVT